MTIERINELSPRTAMIGYCAVMTLWIMLFARTETALPTPLVLLLLLVPPVVHFGLGSPTDTVRVSVRWPTGRTQTLDDVAVDQLVTVEEPPA